MAAINTSVGVLAGCTQGIGWLAPSQVSLCSSVPYEVKDVAGGTTLYWAVSIVVQGMSKVVHFDTSVNAAAFITTVKNGMV